MKKLLFILMFLPFIGFGQSSNFGEKTGCISGPGTCENGYGVYVWESGNKYEGFWKNGKMHGNAGKFTYKSGRIKKGKWINNVYQKPKTSNTTTWKPPATSVCKRVSGIDIALDLL